MIIAHVIGTDRLTEVVVNWMIGLTVPVALAVAALLRRRTVRQVPLLVAAAAGVTLVVSLLFPLFPPAPPLRLSLSDPSPGAQVARPVEFRVCASGEDGGAAEPLNGGNLLAIYVDGTQVSIVSSTEFMVAMGAGDHTVRVELVDAQHRAFEPDVSTAVLLTAGAVAASAPAPDCRR